MKSGREAMRVWEKGSPEGGGGGDQYVAEWVGGMKVYSKERTVNADV